MGRKLNFIALLAFVLMTVFGSGLAAPDAEWSDVLEAHPGDVAWMVVASAFVLLMTPGLAFFYAGMVRSKNVLGMLMQNIFAMGIISTIWAIVGFTLVFGVTEERDDLSGGQIGQCDHRHLLPCAFCNEPEEEPPGIAIRPHRMDGGIALLDQPFVEERAHQVWEVIVPGHARPSGPMLRHGTPSTRNRSLA